MECPGFPGDSAGFNVIVPELVNHVRMIQIGNTIVQAVSLRILFVKVIRYYKRKPAGIALRAGGLRTM